MFLEAGSDESVGLRSNRNTKGTFQERKHMKERIQRWNPEGDLEFTGRSVAYRRA